MFLHAFSVPGELQNGRRVTPLPLQVHTAKLHAVRVSEECMEVCMHRLPLCRQISKHTETTEVKLLWRAHSADLL